MPFEVLRRVAATDFFAAFAVACADSVPARGPECPACRRLARPVVVARAGLVVGIDVCRRCRLCWLDPHELEQIPASERFESSAVAATRRELTVAQVRADVERSRAVANHDFDLEELSHAKQCMVVCGFPVELDPLSTLHPPWLTWGLAAALIVGFAVSLVAPAAVAQSLGFIPAEPFRWLGLPLLSAFFVHGNLAHLAGNVWMLLLVGDDLEERLGRGRLALLLLAATVAGNVLHAIIDVRRELPCIGASGGLAGLITVYACTWPRRQIVVRAPRWVHLVRWAGAESWWSSHFLLLPAWIVFAFWVLLQFLFAWMQNNGVGWVSGAAHLGGVVAGVVALLCWCGRSTAPGEP